MLRSSSSPQFTLPQLSTRFYYSSIYANDFDWTIDTMHFLGEHAFNLPANGAMTSPGGMASALTPELQESFDLCDDGVDWDYIFQNYPPKQWDSDTTSTSSIASPSSPSSSDVSMGTSPFTSPLEMPLDDFSAGICPARHCDEDAIDAVLIYLPDVSIGQPQQQQLVIAEVAALQPVHRIDPAATHIAPKKKCAAVKRNSAKVEAMGPKERRFKCTWDDCTYCEYSNRA